MRSWDTSAIVPLCLDELATPTMRALTDDDPSVEREGFRLLPDRV